MNGRSNRITDLLCSALEEVEQQYFTQILQQKEAIEKQAALRSKMNPSRTRKTRAVRMNKSFECNLLISFVS